MPGYTSPDCLPYFVGSDSPCLNTGSQCDPSTVWCDFATIAEAKLDAYDAVAAAAASPPLAWVETLEPFDVVIGSTTEVTVPFDTVRADTANMVDLDANNSGFTITRSGLYLIFGYLYGRFDTAAANAGDLSLVIEFNPNLFVFGSNSFFQLDAQSTAAIDLSQVSVPIHGMYGLQAGQTLTAQINRGGVSNDFFTITQASMGAAWMGDLPA